VDFWKVAPVVIAILTVLGSLGKWLYERRRLHIYVSINRFRQMQAISAKGHGNFASTYVEMNIRNRAKKTFKGVTLTLPGRAVGYESFEVDGSEGLKPIAKGDKISLGDIQPGHSVHLRFWLSSDLYGRVWAFNRYFQISAEEIDGVIFRTVWPEYAKATFRLWGLVTAISAILLFFALLIWLGPHKQ